MRSFIMYTCVRMNVAKKCSTRMCTGRVHMYVVHSGNRKNTLIKNPKLRDTCMYDMYVCHVHVCMYEGPMNICNMCT